MQTDSSPRKENKRSTIDLDLEDAEEGELKRTQKKTGDEDLNVELKGLQSAISATFQTVDDMRRRLDAAKSDPKTPLSPEEFANRMKIMFEIWMESGNFSIVKIEMEIILDQVGWLLLCDYPKAVEILGAVTDEYIKNITKVNHVWVEYSRILDKIGALWIDMMLSYSSLSAEDKQQWHDKYFSNWVYCDQYEAKKPRSFTFGRTNFRYGGAAPKPKETLIQEYGALAEDEDFIYEPEKYGEQQADDSSMTDESFPTNPTLKDEGMPTSNDNTHMSEQSMTTNKSNMLEPTPPPTPTPAPLLSTMGPMSGAPTSTGAVNTMSSAFSGYRDSKPSKMKPVKFKRTDDSDDEDEDLEGAGRASDGEMEDQPDSLAASGNDKQDDEIEIFGADWGKIKNMQLIGELRWDICKSIGSFDKCLHLAKWMHDREKIVESKLMLGSEDNALEKAMRYFLNL